jgi:hypothetical protein
MVQLSVLLLLSERMVAQSRGLVPTSPVLDVLMVFFAIVSGIQFSCLE